MAIRVLTLTIVLAAAAAAAAQVPASPPAAAAPSGNAANGKKIFAAYGCYQCHGFEGQGGAGARLAPRPRLALPAFTRYMRRPAADMPPYTSKVVSDAEVADIYAFLMTIAQPPPLSSIPQLND